MPGFFTTDFGRGSTDLFTFYCITYRQTALGDSVSDAGANESNDITSGALSGYGSVSHVGIWGTEDLTNGRRIGIILPYNIHTLVAKKATIYSAQLALLLERAGKGSFRTWPATVTFAIHEVLNRDVTTAVTGTSPNGASLRWHASGAAGPVSLFDYNATAEDTNVFTSADLTSFTPGYRYWDVTSAVRNAVLLSQQLILFGPSPAEMATFITTQVNSGVAVDNPAASAGAAHGYFSLVWAPRMALFAAADTAGRPVDRTKILDPDNPASDNRLLFATPEPGTASDYQKSFVVNTGGATTLGVAGSGDIKRGVLTCGRADSGPVNNSGSVSGNTMRSLGGVFDNNGTPTIAATEKTVSGSGWIQPKASDLTKFEVYFTPESTGALLGPLKVAGTATTAVAWSAASTDFEITVASVTTKHLNVKAAKLSSTTGFNIADRFTFTLRADLRDDADSTEALGLMEVAPPDTPGSDTPDAGNTRAASRAFAVQAMQAPHDVLISATTHTHLRLRDVEFFENGDTLTYMDKAGGAQIDVTVETVYNSAHADYATYPDELRLTTQITLGDYDSQSIACTGVAFPTLSPSAFSYLEDGIPAGSTEFSITGDIAPTPAQVIVIDKDAGHSETVNVNSLVANLVDLPGTESTANAYVAGSLVLAVDTTSNAPFFVRANVPNGEDLKNVLGWFRVWEFGPQ